MATYTQALSFAQFVANRLNGLEEYSGYAARAPYGSQDHEAVIYVNRPTADLSARFNEVLSGIRTVDAPEKIIVPVRIVNTQAMDLAAA